MSDDGLSRIAGALSKRRHGAGRKTDPFYDGFGELKPYTPTLRERVSDLIRNNWPGPNPETKTQDLMFLLGLSPAGWAMDAYDAGRSAGSGDYLGAGLVAGTGALPGPNGPMKSMAKRAFGEEKALASNSARIYNPKPLPQRGFEADYTNGALADATGRLETDMDGRPLTGAIVAGRTHAGGGDSAIPVSAYVPLAEKATGRLPQTVAKGSPNLGKGEVGRYVVTRDRRSGRVTDREIFTDKSLAPAQSDMVLAHELAHGIDEISGIVPTAGLDDELRGVYNHLNNPQNHGPRFGPEQHGYSGEQAKRELMAEAIRAYMADLNYLKSVARKTAAAIRAAVNAHPTLSKIIQFNSLAPVGLGLGAAGALRGQGEE